MIIICLVQTSCFSLSAQLRRRRWKLTKPVLLLSVVYRTGKQTSSNVDLSCCCCLVACSMGRSLMVKYPLLLLQNWESEAVLRSFTCFYPNNSQFRPLTNEGASLSQTEDKLSIFWHKLSYLLSSNLEKVLSLRQSKLLWNLADFIDLKPDLMIIQKICSPTKVAISSRLC